MKKVSSILLVMILVIGLLAGCSGDSADTSTEPSTDTTADATTETTDAAADSTADTTADTTAESTEKVEITYWQHSSEARDAMITEIVAQFEAENPNITVNLEFIPQDNYTAKLIPALATDSAPDVFQIQSGMVSKLASQGSIKPLDETVISVDSIQNDFVESTVGALNYDGKYYGLPTDTQTIILYWNKDLLTAAGLDAEKGPQTWTEMFEYARALTKVENGTMVQSGWGHKGYWPEVTAIVEQYGGKFYDSETGKYVFADDAAAIQAITDISNIIRVDKVYDPNFMANWGGFREGKVAMMLGHPGMIGNLATTAPNLNYGVGLIPATDNGSRSTCVTSWAYVMSGKAKSEAATKLIAYLTSEAVEKKWTQTTGELPARKALLTDTELTSDPKVAVCLESLNESFVGPLQTSALNTIWASYYEKIMLTDESLDSILKACQEELNAEAASSTIE